MDTARQLHELDATGWQRGVYDDIKRTFRAPIVNWIFRTTMANEPAFLRYAWGQVKPVFETRAFARYTVAWRDAVLSELADDDSLPTLAFADSDVSPEGYTELRGQLATYDVVAPRLVALFELVDRALHGEPVGHTPDESRAATAPFPDWLDADRGRPPTLVGFEEIPADLAGTVAAVQSFHGFETGLPSIYRTLAGWPSAFVPMWDALEPRFESAAFDRAVAASHERVAALVDSTPYAPRLAPDDLRAVGFDDDTIADVQGLFREFNTGPVETVLPALPALAATVGAEGERSLG